MYCDVDFGDAYAGLGTVGYQVTDHLGASQIPRTTAGVLALGHGKYGADVSLPAGFRGSIYWDTVADGNINAVSSINTPPTVIEIADAWLDRASGVESGVTPRQALRVIASAVAGLVSGAGTSTITFKAINNGGVTRIVATVDPSGDGNRTVVELFLD